jgi:hypothetical protein
MGTRSIKELLQVMLDNQSCFTTGLCHWTTDLYYNSLITRNERYILLDYINESRPSMFSSIDTFLSKDSDYYWKCRNIKPRIKWLKKQISKL